MLIVSNGHGEDAVGMALARALHPAVHAAAYPLAGLGTAYQDIDVLEPRRALPSGGFGFRGNLRGLVADLRSGIVGLWRAQRNTLDGCQGRYRYVIAIGDFYCLWMAGHAGMPIVYVATAKSEYGGPHLWLEIGLMRKLPTVVFARDRLTADALARKGLPARFVGNPLMDTIDLHGPGLTIDRLTGTVTLLPGSRAEAYANFGLLLKMAEAVERAMHANFVCAVAPSIDPLQLHAAAAQAGWRAKGDLLRSASAAVQLTRSFGQAVQVADVVVGLAGTANEQAAGLGKPVVAFPGHGPQFTREFLRYQNRILGEAVVATDHWRGAAEAVVRLLQDPAERSRRGAAGRARMGGPGAVKQIAEEILRRLKVQ